MVYPKSSTRVNTVQNAKLLLDGKKKKEILGQTQPQCLIEKA